MRIFSFGGGVQSTAVMVLVARGVLVYDHLIFCNVGEDSEYPETLEYFNAVAVPYAAEKRIDLIELHKYRFGEIETVYERVMRESRSIPIPIRMSNGAPGIRNCTTDFKIRVIARWLRQHGATIDEPAITGLGISVDEYQRARSKSGFDYQLLEYPLIDLRMNRQDCINLIKDEGLPVPVRSSCYFCPYHSRDEWIRLKSQRPDLFDKVVGIERRLNEKRETIGKDRVWIHQSLRPLDQVVGDQLMMFEEDVNCESGYCFV